MQKVEVNQYELLSSFNSWDGESSVHSRTFRNLLKKKQFRKDIETTKNPYLLKRKIEVYGNIEFREIALVLLKEIYKELTEKRLVTWDDKKKYVFEDVSQFQNILGTDPFHFGWNLCGVALQKNFSTNFEINVFVPVVNHLVDFFQKHFHLNPYYGKSLRDIFVSMGRPQIERDFDVNTWRYHFIYQHELRYPNTFVYYIQKCFGNYIKYWEDDKIFNLLYRSLCKKLDLIEVEPPERIRNNVLYCYHEQKLPISKQKRYTLQHFENSRLTNHEIQKLLRYEPNYVKEENTIFIGKNHPLHPDYVHCFKIRNLSFNTIMEYFLFKLYMVYRSPQEAYKQSKNETCQIENMIEKNFKTFFFRELMETMNNNLDARIHLLKTENKDIVQKDDQDNFLGKNLMDFRSEMTSYVNPKYPIETEMVIFCLEKWLSFWKKMDKTKETEYIHFFFQLFFPNNNIDEIPDNSSDEVLYPIVFNKEENRMVVKKYIENWRGYEKLIHENQVNSLVQQYKDMIENDYLVSNLTSFLKIVEQVKILFSFTCPDIIKTFDKSELNFKQYFISYKVISILQGN